MRCPICSSPLTEVRETRAKDTFIYRRRQCFNGHLFTTHERAISNKPIQEHSPRNGV